jgi:hypothetical protein
MQLDKRVVQWIPGMQQAEAASKAAASNERCDLYAVRRAIFVRQSQGLSNIKSKTLLEFTIVRDPPKRFGRPPTGEFDKTSLVNPITLKSYRQSESSSDMMG